VVGRAPCRHHRLAAASPGSNHPTPRFGETFGTKVAPSCPSPSMIIPDACSLTHGLGQLAGETGSALVGVGRRNRMLGRGSALCRSTALAGKPEMLRVVCTRCARKGSYSVAKLVAQYGRRGNMSKWLRRLVALGLAASPPPKPRSPKARSKALALAGEQIDKLIDPSAPAEERRERKRRLLKGPKEFRDMRSDTRPKSKS
jgi:hypothetical protein